MVSAAVTADSSTGVPVLDVRDLKKYYPLKGGLFGRSAGRVHAVDGVSFHIARGETLALVGESGCGKSTVGKAVLRLIDITAGQVLLHGQRIDNMSQSTLRPMRQRIQVVFQDPFSNLNPRMRVRDILAEPIRNFGLAAGVTIEAYPGEPARRPYEIAMKCLEQGVYVRYGADTIQMAPPFIAERHEIDRMVNVVGEAIQSLG